MVHRVYTVLQSCLYSIYGQYSHYKNKWDSIITGIAQLNAFSIYVEGRLGITAATLSLCYCDPFLSFMMLAAVRVITLIVP